MSLTGASIPAGKKMAPNEAASAKQGKKQMGDKTLSYPVYVLFCDEVPGWLTFGGVIL